MSDKRTCENCKQFIMPEGFAVGVCISYKAEPLYVSPGYCCKLFEPRNNKVKPRRLCDFCERSKFVLGGLGRYSMTMGHTVSIDAQKDTMNITSTTLTVTKKGAAIEDEYFHIKYCPLCGRKLTGEGKK